MKKLIKRIVENQLEKRNLMVQWMTPKEKVRQFIEKLHPLQTNFELMRIGPNNDGGYLVPNDLKDIQACFSPGVDKVSGFEEWCLNNGMKIFLADKSVDNVNLDIPKEQYSFIKKFIGCTKNEDFITLDEWVETTGFKNNNNTDLLLQMDIEGGEYDTIINTSDSLMKQFRIIVIEFHSLDKLWNPHFFHFAEIVFNKLLQTHFCVHIHPNNWSGIETRLGIEIPKVAEFTFIRKDRVSSISKAKTFPHKLDFDNTSNAHIALPMCWYKN